MSQSAFVYEAAGHCPICEADARFTSVSSWYREDLVCSGCGSVPRERALALVLSRSFRGWRRARIHESSPAQRGISPKLARECRRYLPTQFFPTEPLGATVQGFRNENLERQTFADDSFDLVITLDVMEHVNEPDQVLREVARTLAPGGSYVFTVPTYKAEVESERRARYLPDGSLEHLAAPEYHGNPVDDHGSLVTFRYGYDLPELIHQWSGLDVHVVRFHDHHHGILGEMTEVYVCTSTRPRRFPRVPALRRTGRAND
ncbi:class I SAM-dependent methyltransferase [Nocardioides sp. T2.26MG-1]|uniref:class I SAM-dependent methyltransferase n=1 Tax=Nocardioides sp. T2.26MG-1 TaxID=3041166 RepID=UPI002477A942|nr:class I SAM-dependent methyltransferase [Nocardioides sp. T2.26MG-1]CAI9410588.1 Ubiquinone biosynthesis O-methyltransferase, mitochondrial [Nocardioides sp. T2.26MG-1]